MNAYTNALAVRRKIGTGLLAGSLAALLAPGAPAEPPDQNILDDLGEGGIEVRAVNVEGVSGEASGPDDPDQGDEGAEQRRRQLVGQDLGAARREFNEVFNALFDAGDPPDAAFTDAARIHPDFIVNNRVPPRLRSLDTPGLFGAANRKVLEPLGPDDVVRDEGTGLVVTGRVYDALIDTETDGLWTQLPDGGRLWTQTILSPNAAALRLRLDAFELPIGAELIFYNAQNPAEAYGPITGTQGRSAELIPYWSPTVFGNEVRVEYFVPSRATPDDVDAVDPEHAVAIDAPHLSITGALQDFPGEAGDPELPCRLDWRCDATWANIGLAVGHIHFVSGGSGFICSGTMFNRNPSFDATPFFVTANHCINTQAEASSIEVYWLYQTANCNDPDPGHGSVPRTDGSELLESTPPDFTLLGLTPDDIPGGIVWSGWTSANIGVVAGTSIHHPNGVRKSISYGTLEGRDDNRCVNPIDLTYRFDLSDGGQEGGSSGGAVFRNSDQRYVATISCSEGGCAAGENTWEGSLNEAFNSLDEYINRTATDVWVNVAWGGNQEGTVAEPWNELVEGYFGVPGGLTMHVVAGTYQQYSFLGTKALIIQAESGTVTIE